MREQKQILKIIMKGRLQRKLSVNIVACGRTFSSREIAVGFAERDLETLRFHFVVLPVHLCVFANQVK